MMKLSIQYFSVVFSVLLLVQDFSCLVLKESPQTKRKPRNLQEEKEEINEHVLESKSRQKKSQAVVLLTITGLSGALDIYKQEVGCKGETPTLQTKVDLMDEKQQELIALKDEINLLWVPVKNKETRINRMETDMVTITSQISMKDILEANIVTLVDGSLLARLANVTAQLENEINATNEFIEEFPEPADFLAKYYSVAEYAVNLAIKFGIITIYLGGTLVSKLTKKAAKKTATEATTSSSKFKEILKGVKEGLSRGWKYFSKSAPSTSKALSAVGRTISNGIKTTYKALKQNAATISYLATGGVIFFSIVFEAYNLMKFLEQCHEKLDKVEELLDEMDENKENMLKTKKNITLQQEDLDMVYGWMKGNLTSDDFLNFVREFAELNDNVEIKNTTFIDAATTARKYISEIVNADDLETEALNKELIDALASVNYNMTCLRSKLTIIDSLLSDCAKGRDSFDVLYAEAKDQEIKKLLDRCITTGYMSKPEIRQLTTADMEFKNKSSICVRNSETKKNLVCSNWYNDVANTTNAEEANITVSDVEYFISICDPGTVRQTQVDVICGQKQKFVTPYNVTKILFKFNSEQILLAYYDSCHLTKAQIEDICQIKDNGYNVSQVKEKYLYYNEMNVSAVFFNECTKKSDITPFDGNNMCNNQNHGIKYDNPTFVTFWKQYFDKYERQAILDYLETCSTNPPSGDAASRSKYLDRMNEMESFDQQKKSVKPLRIEWI